MPTEQIVEGPATHAARPDVEHLASFELPPNALPTEVVGADGALTPLGAPGPPGAVGDDGGHLSVEPRGIRIREQFLCRRGRSGVEKLEGDVLRIARSLQLHHRGQTSGGAVGHGSLGPDLRIQHLERHGARRARGCGRSGAPLWRRPARRQSDGWSGGRSAAGVHACGRTHVPLRQSGRPPRSPARRRRILHDPRHREGRDQMVAGGRNAPGLRVPHENDAGVHGGAGVRPGLPDRRPDFVAPPSGATSRELGCACHSRRMVGGHRLARSRPPTDPSSTARPTTASGISSSSTTDSGGSAAAAPAAGPTSAAPLVCSDSSTTRWGARLLGSSRRHWWE